MVIYLKDRRSEAMQMFQRGLLDAINLYIQQQLENEYLQKQYDMQMQKQKELLDYKMQLEQQQRNKMLNYLFGYDTPTLEITKPQPIDDNPINTAVQNFLTPQPQQPQQRFNLKTPDIQFQFRQSFTPSLLNKIESNFPIFKIGQKHTEGLLSKQYLKTGIPTIEDHFIAQTYGFELPVTEKPKPKKYEAKVIDGQYFTFDPETGEWIKKGEVKKVVKENPQRMLVDTGDERLLIDKKDGTVIKRYKVNKDPDKTGGRGGDVDMRLKVLDKAINKMMKKYKLDKGMLFATEPTTSNVIETIRKVNPQDAERLQRWYEEYNRIVENIVGIQNKGMQNKKLLGPFSLFESSDF